MNVAHLSDLHLREQGDAIHFARLLDRVAARHPDHLVISGDLLDRWDVRLLHQALDALDARGFLCPARLTVIHGNHDLASGGGHPRRPADLWRLLLRSWDPPPLLRRRRTAFYDLINERAGTAIAQAPPFAKPLGDGARLTCLDTVPLRWLPGSFHQGDFIIHHAQGGMDAAQLAWLAAQPPAALHVLVVHHYPLAVVPFRFDWRRYLNRPGGGFLSGMNIVVPMEIPSDERKAFWEALARAKVRLVLCGHVHRARLERQDGISVGLNGQSGAEWAGRTAAYYQISGEQVTVEHESAASVGSG